MKGGPLLVVGDKGCGQAKLVQAIHRVSLRRGEPLVVVAAPPTTPQELAQTVSRASRGTLCLTLGGKPLDTEVLAMLQSAHTNVRLVVLAGSTDDGVKSVGLDLAARTHRVVIRPLRDRAGDLPTLLDRLLVEERASLRMTDLTARNQSALLKYPWPENLDELRDAARIIAAVVRDGSPHKAAPALEMARSTLYYTMDRLNLKAPLVET